MDSNRLKILISKIYNDGLFHYESSEEKSNELNELEQMTDYENVNELFYSDLAPNYVFDTIIFYEKIKNENFDEKKYIQIISELTNNLGKIKEYELDVYCKLLGKEFNINANEVFDFIFELFGEGLTPEDIYIRLKK
ncbi:hypothetical protein [Clostridium sp. Maddingley MBC34-26]|nr:hypothetical protein [Clostridium sp. Maddingley MBC34-26]EKQ50970.1 MAG: hypothetical protein A370_05252 [Clostridium sp. Maddingley MBC34-26]